MSEKNQERKSTLGKPVVLFFIFAVLCVAAFLIVMLVKSCDADHEEDAIEQEIQQEEVVMANPAESVMMLA